MSADEYVRLPFSGAAPGANANVTVLFNSTTSPQLNASSGGYRFWNFKRYVLALKNSQPGVLKVHGSIDGGANWHQVAQYDIAASTPERAYLIGIPTEPHQEMRVEWTNGGVAQGTWYVAQALDDGEATFRASTQDTSGTTITNMSTSQLPASLGIKPSTGSVSTVEAGDSPVRKSASLRGAVRGEVLAITVGLTSKTFNVPAAWKGYHVRIQADGCDLYYQISTTATPAVADRTARAQEASNPIDLTPSVSGNGCFKIPNGSSFDIPFPANATTFALQASVDSSVARTHLAES